MKGLFDRVGWTSFLEKFSTYHYSPYAFFLGNCKARYDGVSIKEIVTGTQVVISPMTNVVVSGCAMEGLTISKD